MPNLKIANQGLQKPDDYQLITTLFNQARITTSVVNTRDSENNTFLSVNTSTNSSTNPNSVTNISTDTTMVQEGLNLGPSDTTVQTNSNFSTRPLSQQTQDVGSSRHTGDEHQQSGQSGPSTKICKCACTCREFCFCKQIYCMIKHQQQQILILE